MHPLTQPNTFLGAVANKAKAVAQGLVGNGKAGSTDLGLFTKKDLKDPEKRIAFETQFTKDFNSHKEDTRHDLLLRVNGVAAKAGAVGYQFAGYTVLERFYRGDQWTQNEPPGASQRTDNYCAVIIDNLSSLVFDDQPEISCPIDDPSDEMQEVRSELKSKLIRKVWEDNDYEVEFDSWAKCGSLYGDGFLKGPWMEKVDDNGDPVEAGSSKGTWKIKFRHVENAAAIRPIYADASYTRLIGYIDSTRVSFVKAMMMFGQKARDKGIALSATLTSINEARRDPDTLVPMVDIDEYWDAKKMGTFINNKLLDYNFHNWGFVPLTYVKNIYVPNHPYGKSDLEDVLDPQMMHNRVNNDLANLLKWVTTINFWGKNVEGMQALVAGLSRIYSLPEDGELHTFEKTGDPYITNTFAEQRRGAIVEISGVSESMLSSSQVSNTSGRALALAFQGTIRKLNPRVKRYRSALQQLNRNILKLYEIYYPETKPIIGKDYRNEVFIPSTLLRNIVDTINKFQAGLISQDTAMREAGVNRPALERKIMKRDLEDPVLGPQVARQPSLLPQLQEGNNQDAENPIPGQGSPAMASPEGAVAAKVQQATGKKGPVRGK